MILPFTVLRRIDCVLAPTKARVLERNAALSGKLADPDAQLRRASGFAFYNTSRYDFDRLHADAASLAANLRNYINGFSPNMREVIEKFDFDNTISKLDEAGLRERRDARELIRQGESKTLEFKSTLRWSLKEDRKDAKGVTHAALKTIAAFLNTEGGDLLIGVADDGTVVGLEADRLESDDKFLRHLTDVVCEALGRVAATCLDPRIQTVDGKAVCVVACRRSALPVYLKWKGTEKSPDGDFYVRTGPGSRRLEGDEITAYVAAHFGAPA